MLLFEYTRGMQLYDEANRFGMKLTGLYNIEIQ